MKKFFTILCLVLCSMIGASAQEYKKVRVTVGTGITQGYLLFAEPSYRLNDMIAFGARLESALLKSERDKNWLGSIGLTSQYYFPQGNFRPFVGFGVYRYSYDASTSLLCDCSQSTENKSLGFSPRLGFDFGHLTVSTEYNFVQDFKVRTTSFIPDNQLPPSYKFVNVNYFSLKVGLAIGGGKKKIPTTP